MDRRFDDRERPMRRDEWMERRHEYGSERYDDRRRQGEGSPGFHDGDRRSGRDDRGASFYDAPRRGQDHDAAYRERNDDDRDRLGAGRDQDRYEMRGDFRRSERLISDTAGSRRGRDEGYGGSREWSDRRGGEYRTSIYDNRDPDYPREERGAWMDRSSRGDDRDHFRPDDDRSRRGDERRSFDQHGDRRRDADQDRGFGRSRDEDGRYQYHGRDYGFSWRDGSNDATWRQMDRWGNEYSNNARSEGMGINRGSTRDQQFWSSPDRER